MAELHLEFPTADFLQAHFDGDPVGTASFKSPAGETDLEDLRWYLEVYSNQYTTEEDDERAGRIAARLSTLGEALFSAAMGTIELREAYERLSMAEGQRVLTVRSENADILRLPWELLHEPDGAYLSVKRLPISIRRSLLEVRKTSVNSVPATGLLRLLFVVSRPEGATFLNPRGDAGPVLDAVEHLVPGRFEIEFLRPATLMNLVSRLEDTSKPRVDIVHFDGHGAYEKETDQGCVYFTRPGSDTIHRVTGLQFGTAIQEHGVKIVILSACQSAAVIGGDAMAGVATSLVKCGVPIVLAMPYTVLAETTRKLFGTFYSALALGRSPTRAIDESREKLMSDPTRHPIERSQTQFTLQMQDWFVPALYYTGSDEPLLNANIAIDGTYTKSRNTSLAPSDFIGRQHELWQIERRFLAGSRRISVIGPIQYGKSYIVREAADWLVRTGMFRSAVLLDGSDLRHGDPVHFAICKVCSAIGCSVSLDDMRTGLLRSPTLLIFDHPELLPEPQARELLDALTSWTGIGETRLLLAQRSVPTNVERTEDHLAIQGLDPETGLLWFRERWVAANRAGQRLRTRGEIIELVRAGDLQPAFINLAAAVYGISTCGEPNEAPAALAASAAGAAWTEPVRQALDTLQPTLRSCLPALSVLEHGAMEVALITMTGLGLAHQLAEPSVAEQFYTWFRATLESAGLARSQIVCGEYRYVRLHPALAPVLAAELTLEERAAFERSHAELYMKLCAGLYADRDRNPGKVAAIIELEAVNFVKAMMTALQVKLPGAAACTSIVMELFSRFGQHSPSARLSASTHEPEQPLEERAIALQKEGRYAEAISLVKVVLAKLDDAPTYERCTMLQLLGRCHAGLGRADEAANCCLRALHDIEHLPNNAQHKMLAANVALDLGDALQAMGEIAEAREQFARALKLAREQSNVELTSFAQAKLGTCDEAKSNWREEVRNWQATVVHARQTKDDRRLAGALQRLGFAYEAGEDWNRAEQAYREAAEILDAFPGGAGYAWGRLAMLYFRTGQSETALPFFQKAVNAYHNNGDSYHEAVELYNLATLLASVRQLDEANKAAERGVALLEQIGANIADINRFYDLLIEIATKRRDDIAAGAYRERAVGQNRAFFASLDEVKPFRDLVRLTLATIHGDETQRAIAMRMIRKEQVRMRDAGATWSKFSGALDRILEGARDPEKLQIEQQGHVQMLILNTILSGERHVEAVMQGLFPDLFPTEGRGQSAASETATDAENDDVIEQVLSGGNGSEAALRQMYNPDRLRRRGLLQRLSRRIEAEADTERKERLQALRELAVHFLSHVENT